MSRDVKSLVRRLQLRVMWLGLGLGILYCFLDPGRGLLVLTLSVATAIVYLRWLASHVLSLSAPALAAFKPGSASDSGNARQLGTEASSTPLSANDSALSSIENATLPDSGSDLGAAQASAPSRFEPESEDYAQEAPFGSGGSASQKDRQLPIEGSRPSDDSDAETASFSTRAAIVAAILRLPLLLLIVVGLVYVGRPYPLALALGLGTLPLALTLEAWRSDEHP